MSAVVVNAISVKEGGSLVVLRELLAGMAALRPGWRWHVAVNSKVSDSLCVPPNVETVRFPVVDRSALRTRLWYETGLLSLTSRVGADLLLSLTNYLPSRAVPCPTLLLVQHAGHFSPVFRRLTEDRLGIAGQAAWRLKGRWVRSSVLVADKVVVQTAALARRIVDCTGIESARMSVVPHGTGQVRLQCLPASPPRRDELLRIGYITKHGVQKNFPVLFAAVARLKALDVPARLVVTLDPDLPESREVLKCARESGVADLVENHGELPREAIEELYRSLHVFVFPSLCESFGFPIVEAMACGVPLLVADCESSVEVAGAGGRVFPPHDPEGLARELARLAGDAEWFRRRALASLARAADFEWPRAAAEMVDLMEVLMASRVMTTPRSHGLP